MHCLLHPTPTYIYTVAALGSMESMEPERLMNEVMEGWQETEDNEKVV